MKSSKALTENEKVELEEHLTRVALQMECFGYVTLETLQKLNYAVGNIYSLPVRTTVELTVQRVGLCKWSVVVTVGEKVLLGDTIEIPDTVYIES